MYQFLNEALFHGFGLMMFLLVVDWCFGYFFFLCYGFFSVIDAVAIGYLGSWSQSRSSPRPGQRWMIVLNFSSIRRSEGGEVVVMRFQKDESLLGKGHCFRDRNWRSAEIDANVRNPYFLSKKNYVGKAHDQEPIDTPQERGDRPPAQ